MAKTANDIYGKQGSLYNDKTSKFTRKRDSKNKHYWQKQMDQNEQLWYSITEDKEWGNNIEVEEKKTENVQRMRRMNNIDPIKIEELRNSLKELRNRKATGINNINSELLKYGGRTTMMAVCFYRSEYWAYIVMEF